MIHGTIHSFLILAHYFLILFFCSGRLLSYWNDPEIFCDLSSFTTRSRYWWKKIGETTVFVKGLGNKSACCLCLASRMNSILNARWAQVHFQMSVTYVLNIFTPMNPCAWLFLLYRFIINQLIQPTKQIEKIFAVSTTLVHKHFQRCAYSLFKHISKQKFIKYINPTLCTGMTVHTIYP